MDGRPRQHQSSADEPSDAELLRCHVEGDPDAFGKLFVRHKDRLWAVALRTVGDPEDAADALQEAMISAFRRAGDFRGQSAVTTWLHRIVVNASVDRLRRRPTRSITWSGSEEALEALAARAGNNGLGNSGGGNGGPGGSGAGGNALGSGSAGSGVIGAAGAGGLGVSGGSAGESADAVETRLDVDAALQLLPPEQRAALVLVDMLGYPVADVAEILGISPGTVKSRCARGRARLLPHLSHLRGGKIPDGKIPDKKISDEKGNRRASGSVSSGQEGGA
ncbi:MAG TPA: sigma-70 family RNA polymerase sigma factor [Trebonia sp.]|jgi:RNA polymerase sigma-70 factor (ECF subfamily)